MSISDFVNLWTLLYLAVGIGIGYVVAILQKKLSPASVTAELATITAAFEKYKEEVRIQLDSLLKKVESAGNNAVQVTEEAVANEIKSQVTSHLTGFKDRVDNIIEHVEQLGKDELVKLHLIKPDPTTLVATGEATVVSK